MELDALVRKYMSCFFGEEPIENMRELLAHDLEFYGPFYEFGSADAYLESLRENPPEEMSYEILKEYSDSNSCCLIYRFKKEDLETVMSQTFEARDNKISKILLIFDTSKFTNNPPG
ncbi:MAG: hypothetical protein AB2598_05240 [Candidatus Thiodiazotropha sp.]